MNSNLKNLPNILSVCRIVLSIILIIFAKDITVFITIYIICALTDVLDGYIARKYKCESELGGKLDSLGDFVFFMVIITYFILYKQKTIEAFFVPIVIITLIRISTLIICRIKNKKIYSIHTISNKVTGITIIAGMPVYLLTEENTVIWILLSVALFSALEEMLIILVTKNPDINRKSLFVK